MRREFDKETSEFIDRAVAKLASGESLSGVELIAAERRRQISKEGWTAEHDDGHDENELALAAACYALDSNHSEKEIWDARLHDLLWPWEEKWWKPEQDRIRNLVNSGALIAAEIDRLQRLKSR